MIQVEVRTAELRKLISDLKALEKIDLTPLYFKVIKELRKKHGRDYTWARALRANRKNLLSRTGRGLDELEDSSYVRNYKYNSTIRFVTSRLAVHEEGVPAILPKKADYLLVPLPEVLTKNGVIKREYMYPRKIAQTFVKRSKKGNLIIFLNRGRQIIPLFLLKSQTHIPPRLKLQETVETELDKFIGKLLDG